MMEGDRVWAVVGGREQTGTIIRFLPDTSRYIVRLLDGSQVIVDSDLVKKMGSGD